jgi:hypothetical protein
MAEEKTIFLSLRPKKRNATAQRFAGSRRLIPASPLQELFLKKILRRKPEG